MDAGVGCWAQTYKVLVQEAERDGLGGLEMSVAEREILVRLDENVSSTKKESKRAFFAKNVLPSTKD